MDLLEPLKPQDFFKATLKMRHSNASATRLLSNSCAATEDMAQTNQIYF